MANLPRIAKVKVISPYSLRLTWKDGAKGTDTVDLEGLVHRSEFFSPLRDESVFAQATIAAWGACVEWPGGIEWGADNLHAMAREQKPMTNNEFRAWQKEMRLSNQEAARALGLSSKSIGNYRGGAPIPVSVQIACRAMRAQPTTLYAHFRPSAPVGRPRAATRSIRGKRGFQGAPKHTP